ncbi:MAG TPA: hypothetical protein VFC54_09020 [Pseudolabrys sp.]|nr:hypothetical protein [Pseudolabrys sp.]
MAVTVCIVPMAVMPMEAEAARDVGARRVANHATRDQADRTAYHSPSDGAAGRIANTFTGICHGRSQRNSGRYQGNCQEFFHRKLSVFYRICKF